MCCDVTRVESELVADTAVAIVGIRVATEAGSASVAGAMGRCWSSVPAESIPICATASARTMHSATSATSCACGRIDTLDLLVLGLATRWSSDPVAATVGLSDPC